MTFLIFINIVTFEKGKDKLNKISYIHAFAQEAYLYTEYLI